MAGEVEEPFRLNFQANPLHSGSISFGRFESESLCWEKRSSFSHNRYLEEVEKCSKPGLVIEKKAYFEAHFKKKGIPIQTSPAQKDYRTNESCVSDKTDEEIEVERQSPHFDEIPDRSVQHGRQVVASDSDEARIFVVEEKDSAELFEVEEEVSLNSTLTSEGEEYIDGESSDFYTIHLSEKAVGTTDENGNTSPKHQHGSSLKEKVSSESECTNPRLALGVHVVQSKNRILSKEFKSSEKMRKEKVTNVVRRSKIVTKTPGSATPVKREMIKATNCEAGSKAKGGNVIKSVGKESKGATVLPRSSTSQKVPSKAPQTVNRVKKAIVYTKPNANLDRSRIGYKSNEHEERRKELVVLKQQEGSNTRQVHAKTEEKKNEMKPLRKNINFKAAPMPSFYYRASPNSDSKKAVATSNVEKRKVEPNSSRTGVRVANKVERTKQALINETLASAKKENEEKHPSLSKHKVSAIYKGKIVEGRQMKTGQRSASLVSFKK